MRGLWNAFILAALACVASACTSHTMFSRASLAHPTMSPDEFSSDMDAKVHARSEASATSR